jgi:predicted phage tail component-like protein
MSKMTFNGLTKDYVTVLRGRKRPTWAPITRNLTSIPSMPGAYHSSTDVAPRVIEVPIVIKSTSIPNLQTLKEDLAGWLVTSEPCELSFDDEPNRTYYAMVDGELDVDEIVTVGVGIVKFICPDPYKYGDQNTLPFSNGQLTVNNTGSADTYPVITATVTKATTFLAVASQFDTMMVGQPQNADNTPANPFDSVLHEGMDSLNGWAVSALVPDGGIKAGTMTAGVVFKASDYGTGSTWHGPVMQKSLSQQVQDFQIDITCKFETTTVAQAGRLEVYLLDVNSKVIGKLAIKDYTNGTELTMPEIYVKNDSKTNFVLVRNSADNFNDFYGMLRLKRKGREFWASVIRVNPTTGKKISTKEKYLFDTNSDFQGQLSSIAVHFGANGTWSVPTTNQIHEISVVKLNSLTDTQVPYLAQPNDVIEIDHANNSITLNGDSILDKKDFVSNFFPLKKGANLLVVQPSDSVDAQIVYRERYL